MDKSNSSYLEFKNSFNMNDEVDSFLIYLKKLDKTFFIRKILSDVYFDINFYRSFKSVILLKKSELDDDYFNLFNILFYMCPERILESFNYYLCKDVSLELLKGLLTGDIRHRALKVEEVYNKLEVNRKYDIVFYQYFLSKGYTFEKISNIIPYDFKSSLKVEKKLSVALLISGQVRGVEAAVESWSKYFNFSEVELDIYLSSWENSGHPKKLDWNRIGSAENIDLIKNFYNSQSQEKILSELQRFLPPKKLSDQYLKDILSKYLKPNSIQIDLEDDNNFLDFSNPMKLYYKIERCFKMSEENKRYDLYIRLRPDILISGNVIDIKDLYKDIVVSNKIYTQYPYILEYYGFGVDDKIAFATYDVMKTYSYTWSQDYDIKEQMMGHVNLAYNLFNHSINVVKIPELKIRFTNYNLINLDDLL